MEKIKFSNRDKLVIAAVIIGVVGTWFVLAYALLRLAMAGYIVLAWLVLVSLTFWALKRKK